LIISILKEPADEETNTEENVDESMTVCFKIIFKSFHETKELLVQ